MITVPSSEFSKNFGRYREAAQREPIAVTSHDRVTGYFVSGSDYEAYLRLKAQMPKAYAVEKHDTGTKVTVAPITHSPPSGQRPCLEIPLRVKQRLGLDDQHSWVVLDEMNAFLWPGYDLRPIRSKQGGMAYGFLPPRLFNQIRTGILDIFLKRRGKITPRD